MATADIPAEPVFRSYAALALPQDRTALDAALAEARRQGAREAAGRLILIARERAEDCFSGLGSDAADYVVRGLEAVIARIEAGDKEAT